jgi:hypothetical protein
MKRNVDEIDEWAERTFGKRTRSIQNRRTDLRKGLDRLEDKRKFDELFRGVTNDANQTVHRERELSDD